MQTLFHLPCHVQLPNPSQRLIWKQAGSSPTTFAPAGVAPQESTCLANLFVHGPSGLTDCHDLSYDSSSQAHEQVACYVGLGTDISSAKMSPERLHGGGRHKS